MSPPDELFPDWNNRPPRAPGRRDVVFVIVLLGLLALAAVLWFADPAHQPTGKSRVDWPVPATPAKP